MPKAPAADVEVGAFVARTTAELASIARPAVVVIPDQNTWNDYGRRYYATLVVLTPEGGDRDASFTFRLMFEGSGDTDVALRGMLTAAGRPIPLPDIITPFCSLLSEASDYGAIIALLGFDAGIIALRHLRDVVLAEIENESQHDREAMQLSNSVEFHVGVIRSSGRYTALRRGGRYLRPYQPPEVEDSASSFSITARLPGSDLPVEVEFDFSPDEIFEDRICLLIGRNGVGKTQLINALIYALTESNRGDEPADGLDPVLSPKPPVSRTIVFSSANSDPYPRKIAPWRGIDYDYRAMAHDMMPLGAPFMASILDCMRDDGATFGGDSRYTRFSLLEFVLDRLGLFRRLYLPLKADADASDFISSVELHGTRYVSIKQRLNERQENELIAAVDRERSAIMLSNSMEVRSLSSGEVAMMQFCAHAVAAIEPGSLLLLDEPETHLHPNFVTEFMDILQDLLARTRSIAIVASHSAYVLREVPRQRVNVLYVEGSTTLTVQPRLQTFGGNIEELSRFVFQDGEVSPRHRRRLEEWALSNAESLDMDGILERYGDRLSPMTLSIIARTLRGRV